MKRNLVLVLVIAIIGIGVIGYTQFAKPALDNRTVTTVVPTQIQNEEFGLSFKYESGEAGYTLIEPPVSTSSEAAILDSYLIMNTASYIDFQNSEDAREAPPVMSIFIADVPSASTTDNSRNTRISNWAQANPQYTAYNLRTAEPTETEVDGASALEYTVDGLYQQRVVLVFYGGRIYTFIGQYNGSDDPMQEAFNSLLSSVTFN